MPAQRNKANVVLSLFQLEENFKDKAGERENITLRGFFLYLLLLHEIICPK